MESAEHENIIDDFTSSDEEYPACGKDANETLEINAQYNTEGHVNYFKGSINSINKRDGNMSMQDPNTPKKKNSQVNLRHVPAVFAVEEILGGRRDGTGLAMPSPASAPKLSELVNQNEDHNAPPYRQEYFDHSEGPTATINDAEVDEIGWQSQFRISQANRSQLVSYYFQ